MSSRRLLGGLARDQRGGVALETAFCIPVLIVLIFGILQFGWVQHTRSSLRFALETASRKLVIDPDTTEADLQSVVSDRFQTLANGQVTVSLLKTDTTKGRMATLSARYTSVMEIPLVGTFTIPFDVAVTRRIRSS
ncbi:MAG: pilus assembly protein [Caulobacterales bacterium]|nr:pilus assembly protein [Caulobacterales bacterium]